MIASSRQPLLISAFALLLALGSLQIAWAFSDGATRRAVQTGNAELEKCRQVAETQRFSCVANALDASTRPIGRPDYRPAVQIIRQAAAKVRATKKVAVAIAAVDTARRLLLRATGEQKYHYAQLATLMTTAKSVLRS